MSVLLLHHNIDIPLRHVCLVLLAHYLGVFSFSLVPTTTLLLPRVWLLQCQSRLQTLTFGGFRVGYCCCLSQRTELPLHSFYWPEHCEGYEFYYLKRVRGIGFLTLVFQAQAEVSQGLCNILSHIIRMLHLE